MATATDERSEAKADGEGADVKRENRKAGAGKVYEVMIDTWGDKYQRGDLVTEGNCEYDLASAIARGVVREAEYVRGNSVSSVGLPTNPDGSLDWALQQATRFGAGLPEPRTQRILLEAELAGLDSRKEILENEIKRLAAEEDKLAARQQAVNESHVVNVAATPVNPPDPRQVGSAPQPAVSMPAIPGGMTATSREAQEAHEERLAAQQRADKGRKG